MHVQAPAKFIVSRNFPDVIAPVNFGDDRLY